MPRGITRFTKGGMGGAIAQLEREGLVLGRTCIWIAAVWNCRDRFLLLLSLAGLASPVRAVILQAYELYRLLDAVSPGQPYIC